MLDTQLTLLVLCVAICFAQAEISLPKGKELFEKNYGVAAMYEEVSEEVAAANEEQYTRKLASSMGNEGFAYYAFYAQQNCGGTVTYTSGIPANVCLPGVDYDFGGNYYYYSAQRAYKSFMLMNLNDNCQGSTIVFYSDAFCQTYVSTQYLTAGNQYNDNEIFTECYNDANSASSAMVSHRGFCSLGEDIPVTTSSYVYKEYNGTEGCDDDDLQTYTTYTINTCFGYNNHSSASYSCSQTDGDVTMSQYYSTKTCTANSVSFYQTTLNIVAGCFLASNSLSAGYDKYAYNQAYCQMVSGSSSNALSDGAIAGIVVGSVVGAGLIFGIVAFLVFGKATVVGSGVAAASASTITNPLTSPTKGTELI